MSMKGVYLGFFLPLRVLAASVARRPSVLPLASTTNHLRVISCELGKYVDIVTCFSSPEEPGTFLRMGICTARIRGRKNALPQTKGSKSLEWRRIDLKRLFGTLSWQPTWARSSSRSVSVKRLSGPGQRQQRTGRGAAQEDQINATRGRSQPG